MPSYLDQAQDGGVSIAEALLLQLKDADNKIKPEHGTLPDREKGSLVIMMSEIYAQAIDRLFAEMCREFLKSPKEAVTEESEMCRVSIPNRFTQLEEGDKRLVHVFLDKLKRRGHQIIGRDAEYSYHSQSRVLSLDTQYLKVMNQLAAPGSTTDHTFEQP